MLWYSVYFYRYEYKYLNVVSDMNTGISASLIESVLVPVWLLITSIIYTEDMYPQLYRLDK